MAATMQQVLSSSLGLFPDGPSDGCDTPLRGRMASDCATPPDVTAYLELEASAHSDDDEAGGGKVSGFTAALLCNEDEPDHHEEWNYIDNVLKNLDAAAFVGAAAFTSRLATFASFPKEERPRLPDHDPGGHFAKIKLAFEKPMAPGPAPTPGDGTKPSGVNGFGESKGFALPMNPPRPPLSVFGSELRHFPNPHYQAAGQAATRALPSAASTPGLSPGYSPQTGETPPAPAPDPLSEDERKATQIIVEYLSDPLINPYKGSVPLERIQNIFRGKHADLYQRVVGNKHSAWKKYIQRNADTFQQFSVEEGKWRMRLLCHTDWQDGDQKEEAARVAWETHFTTVLASYLETMPDRASSLDAFMAAYYQMPQNQNQGADTEAGKYALPHRGDLVRFIRRSARFAYDQTSFLISFRRDGDARDMTPLGSPRAGGRADADGKPSKDRVKEDAASAAKARPLVGLPSPSPGSVMMTPNSADLMSPLFYAPPYHPHFFQATFFTPTLLPVPGYPVAFTSLVAFAPPQPPPVPAAGAGAAAALASPNPPAEVEHRVTQLIVEFLLDTTINPYQGSVPVERIQNLFRSRYPGPYDEVVGNKHSAWKRFIERHNDVFSIFPIEEGKWRMRLLCHEDWKAGDQKEEAARDAWEHHFTAVLTSFLQEREDKASTLDAFMAAYPNLPENAIKGAETDAPEYPLPHRGDLVRFLRRSAVFSFDPTSFRIGFRQDRDGKTARVSSGDKRGPGPAGAKPVTATKLNPYAPCFRPKSEVHVDA